jgi:hypothetical protein
LFRVGNHAATLHGLDARNLPPKLAHLRAEVAEFLDGAIADEGGLSEVPMRRLADLEYRARLHRRIRQLDEALELYGFFDKRGTLRVAWLTQLRGLIDSARALDGLLGLERKSKPVHPSQWQRPGAGDVPAHDGASRQGVTPPPETSAHAGVEPPTAAMPSRDVPAGKPARQRARVKDLPMSANDTLTTGDDDAESDEG